MKVKLANAPVSWGVDYPDAPGNPPWPRVMSEIAAAGYAYTELGPYGYYPTDPEALRAELAKRRLTIVAGFLFQPQWITIANKKLKGVWGQVPLFVNDFSDWAWE